MAQTEHKLAKTLAQDFSKRTYESEIKKKGEIDSLNMNQLAQNNEFFIERLTQIKEYHMKKMRDTFGTSLHDKQKQAAIDHANSAPQPSRIKARSLDDQAAAESRSDLSNSQEGDFERAADQQFDLNASINQRDTAFKVQRRRRLNS